MSAEFQDDDNVFKPKRRATFVKEVRASSVFEALKRMDDWAHSQYDMYLLKVETYDDNFIKLIIVGIENEYTRELYDV